MTKIVMFTLVLIPRRSSEVRSHQTGEEIRSLNRTRRSITVFRRARRLACHELVESRRTLTPSSLQMNFNVTRQ